MWDSTLDLIDKGYTGELEVFPVMKHPLKSDLSVLNKIAPCMPPTYLSVGGKGGSGKSAFVNQYFLFTPALQLYRHEHNFKWLYYATERDPRVQIMGKMLAWMYYLKTGKPMSVATLFGWPNKSHDLSPIDYEWVKKNLPVAKELLKDVQVVKGHKTVEEIIKIDQSFKEAYPNSSVIRILDHCSNIRSERTNKKLAILEDISDHTANICRDEYGWFAIDVNQFNRDSDDYNRRSGPPKIVPADWYGSSKFEMNCDLMVGILDPLKADAKKLMGHTVDDFRKEQGGHCRIRGVYIVKNSYGPSPYEIPYLFQGECGAYYELQHEPSEREMQEIRFGNILDLR